MWDIFAPPVPDYTGGGYTVDRRYTVRRYIGRRYTAQLSYNSTRKSEPWDLSDPAGIPPNYTCPGRDEN